MEFELTLVCKGEIGNGDMHSIDKVQADNLVKLLAQFMLVIVRVQNSLVQAQMTRVSQDDIPF